MGCCDWRQIFICVFNRLIRLGLPQTIRLFGQQSPSHSRGVWTLPEKPRAVKAEEFDLLGVLVDEAFERSDDRGNPMYEDHPHLFNLNNINNLRVIVENDVVVSHVGMTIRWSTILGCTVKVANAGAIGTHKSFRGQGYATALCEDAILHAAAAGVDFMMISGERSLYHRLGSRPVGKDWEFAIPAQNAAAVQRGDVIPSRFKNADLQAVMRLHELEPVRQVRPLDEWRMVIRDGHTTQHNAEVWVVRRGRAVVACLGVLPADSSKFSVLQEFIGDRRSVLSALSGVIKRTKLAGLTLNVQGYDGLFLSLLALSGVKGEPRHADGTFMIINFTQFMERIRPLIEERVGLQDASRIGFNKVAGRCLFLCDGEVLIDTDIGGASQIIFGTHESIEWNCVGNVPGKELLEASFPIPTVTSGFSYV